MAKRRPNRTKLTVLRHDFLTWQRNVTSQLAESHIKVGQILINAVFGAGKYEYLNVAALAGSPILCDEQIVRHVVLAHPHGQLVKLVHLLRHLLIVIIVFEYYTDAFRGRPTAQTIDITAGQLIQRGLVYIQILGHLQ